MIDIVGTLGGVSHMPACTPEVAVPLNMDIKDKANPDADARLRHQPPH